MLNNISKNQIKHEAKLNHLKCLKAILGLAAYYDKEIKLAQKSVHCPKEAIDEYIKKREWTLGIAKKLSTG